MRITRWALPLMAALMVGAAALPDTARAAISFGGAYRDENIAVDVSYFYDELSPFGNWVDYGSATRTRHFGHAIQTKMTDR